jgi:hypothetical protein
LKELVRCYPMRNMLRRSRVGDVSWLEKNSKLSSIPDPTTFLGRFKMSQIDRREIRRGPRTAYRDFCDWMLLRQMEEDLTSLWNNFSVTSLK